MKATELRIGNYINTINRGGEVHLPDDTVFTIQKLGSKCELCIIDKKPWEEINLPEIFYYDLSPIPLTEEWLLKFGFNLLGNTISHACFGDNPITHDYMIKLIKTDKEWFYKNSYHEIKYVHQLQNLYFALTGEELKTS